MKRWVLIATIWLLWLMVPTTVFAQAQDFTFTRTNLPTGFINPVVSRPHTYDNAPSAIQEGNEIKVWYCGGGVVGDPYNGHDSIYYASYNATTGATITSPQRVVWPTLNDTNDDGDMACAVTVAKQQNPNIANFSGIMGAPQYKMWYECAPRTYRKSDGGVQGCFTQICHAASDDGIHWRKWEALDAQGGSWRFNEQSTTVVNNPVKATAVITIPQIVKDNVQLENRNGKLYAYFGDNAGCNNINNYGVGHPTAVTLQPQSDGFQKIKLWYYDSQGDWNSRAMTYVESWDGFHFEAPVKTNLKSPNKIKYINVPVAGHAGFYLSTMDAGLNFFNYSWDGINWFWGDGGGSYGFGTAFWPTGENASFYTDYLGNHFNIGSVTQCVTGVGTFVGDQNGYINTLAVKFLSAEGFFGKYDNCTATNGCKCYSPAEDVSRGNTWDIYTLTGDFNYTGVISTPTPTPIPGDLNGDTHVDNTDYQLFLADFGKTGSPGFTLADINGDGKVDIFDYNILVGNFGK